VSRRNLLWSVTLLLVAAPALAQGTPTEETEVRAVARGFKEALARGDSLGALALLHPGVLILEGSARETKEEYRSGHLAADIAYAMAVQQETLRDGVTITGEVALYTRQYRATGRYRDRDVDRTGIEALILTRTPDGWRIRHVHWF
jgi:ketosteroid isomerase-like protein